MEYGTSALLFFYGLFWAEILATSARYKGFPTVTLWAEWKYRSKRVKQVKRIIVSLSILNIFPIVWLYVLYACVVPKKSGILPVIMAALASLSIFGIIRLYHGVVASRETMKIFYTDQELKKWDIHGGDEPHHIWAHLGPGLLYLACYPVAAIALGYLQKAVLCLF